MRAVVLRTHGGPEVLTIESVPDPEPGPEEVLVDIVASALNRADLLQRMGHYPGPPMAHEIPGLEFSGRVAARGSRAVLWEPGDAVMGIVGGGGYAERIAVHERQVMAVPASVGVADGAAIPEVFLTAWDALVRAGRPHVGALVARPRRRVGRGHRRHPDRQGDRRPGRRRRARPGKAAVCRELGADLVLERSPHDWLGELRSHVPRRRRRRARRRRRRRGRPQHRRPRPQGPHHPGRHDERAAAWPTSASSWASGPRVIGTVLRPRPLEEKIALTQRFAAEMLPLFDTGVLRPVIDSRFPLDAVADAHARMESNANAGKILLDVNA